MPFCWICAFLFYIGKERKEGVKGWRLTDTPISLFYLILFHRCGWWEIGTLCGSEKEINNSIPRKRKMLGACPSSFARKSHFTSLVSSDGEKRHHVYKACTIVIFEIIHTDDVQCNTKVPKCT